MGRLLDRYVFKTTFWSFATALGVLTTMIWMTSALREFDLLTTKGQSLIVFLFVTGLTIPSLVMIIAPIALFIAILYSLNKLNSDSELIVMSASGLSTAWLLRPIIVLIFIVSLIVASMSLSLMPWSFHALRDLITQVRADFLTRVVRAGSFTTLEQGFIFHYRERGPSGELLGIFMQDRRDPDHTATYLAERGETVDLGDSDYLVLEKGSVQRQQPGSRDAAMVAFDRYAIDLAQFGPDPNSETSYKPRERSTTELLQLTRADKSEIAQTGKYQIGKFRAELHDRIVNPLYAFAFGLIAFCALGQAKTTRQGRGYAILWAVAAVSVVRILGFIAANAVARTGYAIPFVYGVPVLATLVPALILFMPRFPRRQRRTASWSSVPRPA